MLAPDDARQQARRQFDAAEFDESLRTARQGLSIAPDDVELLVLAGRAGVEVDADDAVEHLRRATELAPDDPGAWHYLGEALAAAGNTADADGAFRRAVELDPADEVALIHLGHTSLAAGLKEEGVAYLAQAAEIAHAVSTASVSLVDMYRSLGQFEEALTQAQRVAEAVPEDLLAWLDLAEISLTVGRLDDARSAFEHLRELDDVPGHEAYPLHGLMQVEIRRERWDRARELATQVGAIDPVGLSAELTAFVDERTGEASDRPEPSRSEVEAALSSSLVDYRRTLADDRHLSAGDLFG